MDTIRDRRYTKPRRSGNEEEERLVEGHTSVLIVDRDSFKASDEEVAELELVTEGFLTVQYRFCLLAMQEC